ncbi:hypothetical protein BU17DRAFT_56970 [Hysterangium stoloniferum]|nr:hypothetical protein BU17DRAFT_56970 [Hysterangium stoloniferum]
MTSTTTQIPTRSPFSNSYSPSGSVDTMSVSEIKDLAKSNVQKIKNASLTSLFGVAKDLSESALVAENQGDLKSALRGYIMASSLIQNIYDHHAYKAEEADPKKRGVFWKEFKEFNRVSTTHNKDANGTADAADAPNRKPGSSIADRIQALQGQGLSVGVSKRISKDLSATTPPSPRPRPLSIVAKPPMSISSTLASPPPTSTAHLAASPLVAPSTLSSPHTFVSTSSFGPPSPTSSAASSPPPTFDIAAMSEFMSAFPSIDELDEKGYNFPSVPTAEPGSARAHNPANLPSAQNPSASPHAFTSGAHRGPPPPRPASTPIPPINNGISQPPSPEDGSPVADMRRELPVPPSAFELKPTSTIYPKTLNEYRRHSYPKILYLDVRPRSEFDMERMRAVEIVCIEPSILTRAKLTSTTIDSALVVSPSTERVLFTNRAKFDLVVLYDNKSTVIDGPLSNLVRAICEMEFVTFLKRPPVLLVGGLEAWKQEVGDDGLLKGENPLDAATALRSAASPELTSTSPVRQPPPSPMQPIHPSTQAAAVPTPPSPLPHLSSPGPPSSSPMLPNSSPIPSIPTALLPGGSPSPAYNPHYNPHHNSQSALGLSYTQPPTSIQYPSVMPSPYPASSLMGSSSTSSGPSTSSFRQSSGENFVSPPPIASINPSPLSRRRSDYADQVHQAYSGLTHPSIDYPDLSAQYLLRPPPAAASSALERQDQRPRNVHHAHPYSPARMTGPVAPTIQSDYPVVYWADLQIGISGLKNLGNTCYMNATIQCLSATFPFSRFFTDGRWKNAVNMVNPLGSKGNMARAFATLLHDIWHGDLPYLSPNGFRKSICTFAPQFSGSDQHDSQEFLSFLLDGLHEDLNRVLHKVHIDTTPDHEARLELMPQQVASEQEWKIYRMRNDSIVVDYFQGQFRNRLQCLTCHKTSTTYNPFMYLSLPLPSGRTAKTSLEQCLDAFVKDEVLEKSEAWNCPNCRTLRKATKKLSLSRLPPVLMIHLKRFSFKGPFTDKLDTLVDFPIKGLDLTNYMPSPLPPSADNHRSHAMTTDDPRTQLPPYRYDLYGVTNHFGSLSSGHYTAYIASRGGWLYCDDSRVTNADSKNIVGRPAYVLYYKRVQT